MTAETTAPDPTAVMLRRVVAYYIDLAIYLAAALVPLAVLADSRSIVVGESFNDIGRLDGGDLYAFRGTTVYTITESQVVTSGLIALAVFLLLAVVLQGLTGRTVGKYATGIRAVRPDGSQPGIGRAFIRELCWIIDGIPGLVVPVVGGVLALVTTGRRRLGDMLGRTYVVHRRFAGTAIVHPDAGEPDLDDGGGDEAGATDSAPPVSMAAGDEAGPADSAPPVSMAEADEAAEADADAVTDDQGAADATWSPAEDSTPDDSGADDAVVAATATEPDGDAGASDAGTPDADTDRPTRPRWDPDRRAYISFDPRREEWVQHDTETGEWGPISQA